jgi:hypothetical protein
MATNQNRFIENVYGAPGPLVMLGIFQAGGTQAAKRGEMFYLNTNFIPVTADINLAATGVIVNEEIKAGDRAGYYEIIVPRPGDIFEFALDVAAATAIGAALNCGATYPTESFAVGGSHPTAYAVGQSHYPLKQGHLSDDAGPDMGTTVRTASRVRCMFELASSYFAAFNK